MLRYFLSNLVFLMLAVETQSLAQEVPRIRNFAPAEYNAQNQNWALVQNTRTGGWLYAANNGGLLEFDGARWQMFTLPEQQTVRAVAIGRDGEVFCGGFAEFGYWKADGTGRLFYTSLSGHVSGNQLTKEEIWHIVAMPDYVLFQSFSTIYKFDYQKVVALQPPNSIMFARNVGGQILLPVIGRGLYELLPDNTFRIMPGSEMLSREIVQFLVSNGSGGVWAGTTNHGIFELRNGQCSPWAPPLNADFRKYQLNKAIALRGGGWAIGTILNGVYILDSIGQLRYQLNRENGLQNNTVLAIAEDFDGNLWLGLDRGIDFVSLRSPLTFFTDQTGKIGTTYTAAQHAGRLYLGTNQGVFESSKFEVRSSNFELLEGTQGQVWQLQVFDDQLICGHNGGTFIIQNGVSQKISDVTGGWCTLRVPGRPDVLLQSTYTGLVLFKKNDAGRWQFAHRVNGFLEPLRKINFDADGTLWGTHPNKGLFRLRLSDDLTQVVEFRAFTRADGLPSDYRLDLMNFDGQIVVNTMPVAVQMQAQNGTVGFKEFRDLPAARKWLQTKDGAYFVLDSSGLWLLSSQHRQNLPLSLVSGYENIVALPDSTYLFCLENGFARLDQRRQQLAGASAPEMAPAPVIRGIEATESGQQFTATGNYQFAYRQNSLKFHFAVPFFEHAAKFSWRLDGFSTQWSPWQTAAEKDFTNLPPGRYTLRVRTDISSVEASASFRIAPPWYQSDWALVLYALLALGVIWGIEMINRRRLGHQRQRLEAENAAELARQRAEAEREMLLLEVENQSRELSNAAFNLIRKNEAMQGLKDELLSSKLESKHEPRALQKIVRHIDEHMESDHDWAIFEESFNRVHDDFFKRLMHNFPDLTPGDMRLAAYLKMNLSSKEIAPLLNISVRGVENKRYRLRKKLGLGEEANLTEFIIGF